MSIEPLKKELESIDQELEIAMLHLSETTQRVDDLLADFSAEGTAPRHTPAGSSERFDPSASAESDAENE